MKDGKRPQDLCDNVTTVLRHLIFGSQGPDLAVIPWRTSGNYTYSVPEFLRKNFKSNFVFLSNNLLLGREGETMDILIKSVTVQMIVLQSFGTDTWVQSSRICL